jgi:hypothetical protein
MFPIKPRSLGGMNNKKLAPIRMRTGIRHRDNTFFVCEIWMKFIFKFVSINTLTTPTSTCRITSLKHKISNNTVKNSTIIVASLREFHEVFRSLWDFVSKYLKGNIAMISMEGDSRIHKKVSKK